MTPDRSKQLYIKINSIEEIDPNKLSISQITQKYIDKDNNRYALRFNKETRRIEIIKLGVNQHYEVVKQEPKHSGNETTVTNSPPEISAPSTQKPNPHPETKPISVEKSVKPVEIPKEKLSQPLEENLLGADIELDIFKPGEEPPNPSSSYEDDSNEEQSSQTAPMEAESPTLNLGDTSQSLTPQQRIEEFIKQLGIYRERANAIIKNLQSSRIFEVTGDPSENKNIVGNFAREMESRVFEAMDKMVDLHKEMTSYPRPITYYISKAPPDKREEMRLIESDKEKLDKLHLFEMQKHTEAIIRDLKELSLQLMTILNIKTEVQVKQLQYPNQLMYVDAKNASLYFAQDLDKSILDVQNWKHSK